MFSSFITQLSARSEPALHWSGGCGELELTGRVFANWVYKSTALWQEYDAQALAVITDDHVHWRAFAAALAAAGLGIPVHFLAPDAVPPAGAHLALAPEGLEAAEAAFDADEVFVYAEAPLALSTTVDDDFLDFITEVRSRPDIVPLDDSESLTLIFAGTEFSTQVPTSPGPDAVLTSSPNNEAELTSALSALLGGILTLR